MYTFYLLTYHKLRLAAMWTNSNSSSFDTNDIRASGGYIAPYSTSSVCSFD